MRLTEIRSCKIRLKKKRGKDDGCGRGITIVLEEVKDVEDWEGDSIGGDLVRNTRDLRP